MPIFLQSPVTEIMKVIAFYEATLHFACKQSDMFHLPLLRLSAYGLAVQFWDVRSGFQRKPGPVWARTRNQPELESKGTERSREAGRKTVSRWGRRRLSPSAGLLTEKVWSACNTGMLIRALCFRDFLFAVLYYTCFITDSFPVWYANVWTGLRLHSKEVYCW